MMEWAINGSYGYDCVESCYEGYFNDTDSRGPLTCIACHEACTECYGEDISNCTACAEGYFKADREDGCKPDREGDESTETLDCVDNDQCLMGQGIYLPCIA
jgi:hypothetical protein